METQNNEFNVDESSLPKEKWWHENYLIQMDGFWFIPEHVPGIVRVLNEFNPLPNDVILASFPKTGTTWLKSLVFSIIHRSSKESLLNHHPHKLVPFLEYVFSPLSSSSSPNIELISSNHHDGEIRKRRIFGTHIPYQLLGKTLDDKSCRVVYVTRNPKDTLVSAWHFINKVKGMNENGLYCPLDEAQNKFCSGITPYGPYYDHVMGFKKASLDKPENIFFITYEELIADTEVHVKRLAEFLGCPFADDKEEEVLEVVKGCSFEILSRHEVNKSGEIPCWFPAPYSSYFRQGGIEDHKNYLDANTIERIDALTRDKFHAAGFMYGI